MLVFFQNHDRAALAHDKAAAALIERAAGVLRVGAGSQGRHVSEARHADRRDRRLGAARDDRVEIAVLNRAVRLADLIVARGAGGRDRQAGTLRVELDRDVAARDVRDQHRDEVRGNALRTLFVEHRHLVRKGLDAADTRAEIHAEALRIDLAEDLAVVHGLRGRRHRKLREQVVFAPRALIHIKKRVKILDLRRNMRLVVRGIELRDLRDAALAGLQAFPEGLHVVADRRHRAETRDHNSSFHFLFPFCMICSRA